MGMTVIPPSTVVLNSSKEPIMKALILWNLISMCQRPNCILASITQTSDAKLRVEQKPQMPKSILPISIFGSHTTFVHLKLMPMESDGICMSLLLKNLHKDIIIMVFER